MTDYSEAKIYSQFFGNLAVAWFSAGVITPFVVQSITFIQLAVSLFSLVGSYLSLKYAIYLLKECT